MSFLAALAWPILERIPLVGDFKISPHGISTALGFLLGAQLMLSRALRRGVARRPVAGIPETIQSLVTRAAIGGSSGRASSTSSRDRSSSPTRSAGSGSGRVG